MSAPVIEKLYTGVKMEPSLTHVRKASIAFEKSAELELVVLKTHLLIEEKLREYLGNAFEDSSSIDKANLTFHQLLRLSRSLKVITQLNWFWESVSALNKLRNEMAHELDCELNDKRLEPVIRPILKTGMAHIPQEAKDLLDPINGPLSFLYSQSCVLATGSGIFKHRV